jgi:hypothetical protein
MRMHVLLLLLLQVVRREGMSRGFGFVTFKDEISVEKCLLVNHYIKGRKVELKRAVPKVCENRQPGHHSQQHSRAQHPLCLRVDGCCCFSVAYALPVVICLPPGHGWHPAATPRE